MSNDSESAQRTDLAEERTDWAEDRTKWADQRTYLAQQRTFAGWVRTGIASIAVGFGFVEFMSEVEPIWLVSAIGLIFIIVGAIIEIMAFISYRNVTLYMQRSDRPEMGLPNWWAAVITTGLVICAIGGVYLVF